MGAGSTGHEADMRAYLDFRAEHRGSDVISSLAVGDGSTVELTRTQLRAVLAENARMRELLGIGLEAEQWEAIAETEGRRFEAEQTDDTIVGYLAYGWADMKAQRHVLLSEIKELNQRLTAHTRQLRLAYRSGWDDRGEDAVAAIGRGGFLKAESRAKIYVDRIKVTTPQQPARDTAKAPTCGYPACDYPDHQRDMDGGVEHG